MGSVTPIPTSTDSRAARIAPISVDVKPEIIAGLLGMPNFQLGKDIHENVRALRVALGSVTKELSRDDLAKLIRDEHPEGRTLNGTTVQRWEADVDPDLQSLRIMAKLAGVSFEQFALGVTADDALPTSNPQGEGEKNRRAGSDR